MTAMNGAKKLKPSKDTYGAFTKIPPSSSYKGDMPGKALFQDRKRCNPLISPLLNDVGG